MLCEVFDSQLGKLAAISRRRHKGIYLHQARQTLEYRKDVVYIWDESCAAPSSDDKHSDMAAPRGK